MRARPVNLSAGEAPTKIFVIKARERFEPIQDFTFLDATQDPVAAQAPCPRSDRLLKLETLDDFESLVFGHRRTRAISITHNPVHEQAPVAREQSALFLHHYGEQGFVGCVVVVNDVEPKQAEIAREFPEVTIRDKSPEPALLQSHRGKQGWRRRDRKNIDLFIAYQMIRKGKRSAAGHDQIDFGMRNTAGFNGVLDGRFFVQSLFDLVRLRGWCPKEERKIAVEAQSRRECIPGKGDVHSRLILPR